MVCSSLLCEIIKNHTTKKLLFFRSLSLYYLCYMASTKRNPLIIFYLLVIYIILQFGWWTKLLVDLNQELYQQKVEISLNGSPEYLQEMNAALEKQIWMIAGEGSVFLIILAWGMTKVHKSFKKEVEVVAQQRNFLLSITHELKSPIASSKLYLQTLLKRDLSKEKQEEIIRKAIKDTDRLDMLVENILLATKIENSTLPLHKEHINLSAFITELIAHGIETTGQQHTTALHIDDGVEFPVDRVAFSSIVTNLYENAVKYSPAGSTITVTLQQHSNGILFSVADEGEGIPASEINKVFNKFYRLGNEETRKTKGTGLGLFIVKHFVTLHHGTIDVQNNSPKGTIFTAKFNSTE